MFILTVSILFLMIHQGQCDMKATAVLYGDRSATSYGTLILHQDDADAPVRITGTLSGLNASSAHVCLIKERKKMNDAFLVLGFPCSYKSCIRWFT
jgi:hypothetical protein